jgi:RNA polymerase sigma-70 factor (ECF subfamily)
MSMHSLDASKDARFEREALVYLPEVSRYALSLTRNQSEADDLVQDTFLNAYRAWHQYLDGSECRAWLFTICRHQFLRTRRRDQRALVPDDAVGEALAAAALHASAREANLQEMFERSEVIDAIESAIGELPLAYREVAILVDVHDQSYDTASRVLGVPIGTVRSRLFRARRILQEKLVTYARDAGLGAARGPADAGQPRSSSP